MSPVSKVAPKAKAKPKAKPAVRKRRLPVGARERAPIVVERLALEYGDAHTELDFLIRGSCWFR